MKKRILAAILAVLMLMPMAFTVFADEEPPVKVVIPDYTKADAKKSDDAKLATMEHIASSPNGNMLLYVDKLSGEMGIKNMTTGKIVFSNPYDIKDSTLLNREKPYALSQIDLNFTIISSGEVRTFHSYSDCFLANQARIETLEDGNGIKVYYALGKQEQRLLVPNKIKVETFNKVLEEIKVNIAPECETEIRTKYANEIAAGTKTEAEIKDLIQQEIEKDYTNIREKILGGYMIFGRESEEYKIPEAMAEKAMKEYPICAEHYIYVVQNVGAANQYIEDYLKKYTSYTFEKLDADYKEVEEKGIDDFSTDERPKFEVEATYEVTDEGLIATVDTSSLAYDTSKYSVNTISILPYFNAAHATRKVAIGGQDSEYVTDIGYTFIPDGSGALVRFEDLYADNNKQVKFENTMYGNDYAYYQVTTKNAANMTMPVFGLSNHTEDKGFFAVIEDGDSLAIITSNHSTAYHSIYSTFKITPSDVYDLADSFSGGSSASKKISIRAEKIYKGECKVNYMLLTDKEVAEENGIEKYYDNTYVGMANRYRDYLAEKGAISKIPDEKINRDYVKLFLETFGSIQVEEKIATFPVTVNKELTTFNDIKTMYAELTMPKDEENNLIEEDKIGNISFILKGFNNGGLRTEYPTYIEWQDVLGGDEGFEELLEYAKNNNFDVIPDIEFSYSYGGGISNDDHGVRTLDNRYTTKRTYYAATQTFERTGGVAVSSGSFDYLYGLFYEDMSQFENVNFLSVRSLGSDLNSDFDKEEYYDREASKDNVVAMLQLLKGVTGNKPYNLLIDAGNSYAMPYATAVLSVSLDSSRRSEMSESVPFYGIVYHGSVEFAGDAYNMEGDTEYALLKAIENGACLYFTVAKQNVELLKFDPEYNKYYSVSYDNLKSTIVDTYKVYNEAMKDVQDKYIVDHGFLNAIRTEDGSEVDSSLVVMVEYEGGIGFVLNYSSDEIEVVMPTGEIKVLQPFDFEKYIR